MRLALTIFLVLSAPVALLAGQALMWWPRQFQSYLADGSLYTGGALWNLGVPLAAPLWVACAAWIAHLWFGSADQRKTNGGLNLVVASLLATGVLLTAFFAYVLWAWSQM